MSRESRHAELEDRHRGSLMARRPIPPLVRGEGCTLYDTDGTGYLDFTAAYGTASLGHAHPALAAALAEQARTLLACAGNLYCAERARFLDLLHRRLPDHLVCTFLSSSGTEAIEAGIKLARLATGRAGLVAIKGSFHGRTTGALSVTWSPPSRNPFAPLLEPVRFVDREDSAGLEAALDADIAALVVEVIQGEGGVHPLSADFLQAAAARCRERGALLFVDEVQTGVGRTGSWLAHTELGIEPDLLALGKGIAGGFPLAATCFTERVAETLFPGAHASTFGGNPLACRAGSTTLEVLAAEGLVERSAVLGERLTEGLRNRLAGSPLVREVRGRGLMVGVELRRKVGPVLAELLRRERILALAAGSTVLRFLPPLVVAQEQIDLVIEATAEVLRG